MGLVENVVVLRVTTQGLEIYSSNPEHQQRLAAMARQAAQRPRGKPPERHACWVTQHAPQASELAFLLEPPGPDAESQLLHIPPFVQRLVTTSASQARALAAGVDEDLAALVADAASFYVAYERHCVRHGRAPIARGPLQRPGEAALSAEEASQASDGAARKKRLRGWLPERSSQAWAGLSVRRLRQEIEYDWAAAEEAHAAGLPPRYAEHPLGDPVADALI